MLRPLTGVIQTTLHALHNLSLSTLILILQTKHVVYTVFSEHVHRQTSAWFCLSLVSSRTSKLLRSATSLSVWSRRVRWVVLRSFRRQLLWAALRNWACSEIKHWISNVTSSNLSLVSFSRLHSASWNKKWWKYAEWVSAFTLGNWMF